MNLTEPFSLKQTNVSQPRLSHPPSKQSVAASEDYYSFSDYADSVGDDTARLHPPQRFETPPSRKHTPENAQGQSQSSATVQSLKPVRSRQRIGEPAARDQIRRKPLSNSPTKELVLGAEQKSLASQKRRATEGKKVSNMDPFSPSTTPGIDETPYIHFALDQLTRDEEVRGSRHYPGQGYEKEEEEEDDEIFEAPVTNKSSRAGKAPVSDRTSKADTAPLSDRISSQASTGYISRQKSDRKKDDMARQKEIQAGTAPHHPLQDMSESTSSVARHQFDVFVPYDPPLPSNQQPKLNFLPGILRPGWLGIFILLCILMLVGLLFCATFSRSHNGIWNYVNFGDNRYFVFEYLPTVFGMLILTWLFQVQIAVQRISPFIAMASKSTRSRSESSFLDLYPTNFIFPKFQHFTANQPVIGSCFFVFWLFLFTIPLLASAFNVRFYAEIDGGVWRWVAVQGVIWTTIVLYILLILALITLAIKLWRTPTGLKWDARSLADIIALLERANMINDYADTETFQNMAQFKQRLWNRTDRLGYWHTSRRPQDIFYGLGEEGGATRRYSVEQGRIREKPPGRPNHSAQSSISSIEDIEANPPTTAGDFNIRADIRNANVRRRYMPWYLSSSAILAWIIIAIVLLIAFYVVAFVNQASTRGFFPQLGAAANSEGFSPANFLYSFIPCLLGFIIYLLWLPLDFTHRRLAPFAAMSGPNGANAEKSLLLDYPFAMPFSVTLSALSNRHYKVALLSALSSINTVIPVLSGGIFWAQWYPGEERVRIAAQPAGLYALCFFLAIYTVSLFALVSGRKTVALPHGARTLSEIISWLYMSPLLCDRAFARCQIKAELVARLVGVRPDGEPLRKKPSFWQSMTNLVSGGLGPRSTSRVDVDSNFGEGPSTALPQKEKRLSVVPEGHGLAPKAATMLGEDFRNVNPRSSAERARDMEKRKEVRYGFGVFIGRDGREHLGIERVERGGREMVLFQDHGKGRTRTSWIGF